MNQLRHLRLGARLGLAFAAVLGLLLVVAAIGVFSLRGINGAMHSVTDDFYVKVALVSDIKDEINKQARYVRNTVIFETRQERDKELERLAESRATTNKLYERLTPMVKSPEGKALLDRLMVQRGDYRTSVDKFTEQVKGDQIPAARTHLLGELRGKQLEYMETMEKFSNLQDRLMDEAVKSADRELSQALTIVAIVSAAAVAIGALCAWAITRSIVAPINEAVKVAERVAGGDLTVRIESDSRDETGQLLAALRRMTESLVGIVGQVRQSSESIATGSAQIATGNSDLSQRTEEQASNLQQTAASMEQLTATVKQNAETARTATQLAQSANGAAGRGGEAVAQVISTMTEISESSKKISDIIGTIDGIAFQTNILALNAAVEAARAGEQGRGFAVVAGEVRALAQRSAEAAREIKGLIGASVEQVESGTRLVDDAGNTIRDVVAQVQKVADLIAEIGAATNEQTQGIEQVGSAVMQLDQVTQQNAALVEESAAAADSLKQQASKLVDAVGVFRIAA